MISMCKLYTVARVNENGEIINWHKTGRHPTVCCYDNLGSAKRECGFMNKRTTKSYKIFELKVVDENV